MAIRPVPITREAETLSLTEAAQVLGIGRTTAYDLAQTGQFPVPVLRIGRQWRVARIQLDRLLSGESTTTKNDPATGVISSERRAAPTTAAS